MSVLADFHYHRASEFGVTVCDSSRARKGKAWRRILPIVPGPGRVWAKTQVAHGLSSGQWLIWEITDPTDKNGTIAVRDPGVVGNRILVVESELGRVLRVLARNLAA